MNDYNKNLIGDWYNTLGEKFWESEGLTKLGSLLSVEYQKYKCYPEPQNIFLAFNKCQYKDLKFLIIGQDVYPGGEGTGICFGIDHNKTIKIPPSLEKIYKAVEKECYDGFLVEFDYSLEYLCRQGGLLLNSSLTVRKGIPGSHNYI